MRIFSLLPALFFSVTSFVAATPIASNAVNDGSMIQGVIDTISTATSELQPLNERLTNANKASPPDVDQVGSIVSQVAAIVSNSAVQLQTAVQSADSTSFDWTILGPVVSDFASSLNAIVQDLNETPNSLSNAVAPLNDLLTSIETFKGTYVINHPAHFDGIEGLLDSLLRVLDALLASLGLRIHLK